MKKQKSNLSPRERIEAVLRLHQVESPGSPISVAAVCAQASVSRANLYEHHSDLVERIRGPAKAAKKPSTATSALVDLRRILANEKKKIKALQYLCVELQAEIHRLRSLAVLDAAPPAKKSRLRA